MEKESFLTFSNCRVHSLLLQPARVSSGADNDDLIADDLNARVSETTCKRRSGSLQYGRKTNNSRFTPFDCAAAGGTDKSSSINKEKESAVAACFEAMQKASGCMGIFGGQTRAWVACPPFDSTEDSSGR